MLKKAVLWLILGVFCTPLFLQTWQGHAFGHALHNIYQPPTHDHHAHMHDAHSFSDNKLHHLLPNAVFYFSDFLNLDLQITTLHKGQKVFNLRHKMPQVPVFVQRQALSFRRVMPPYVQSAQSPPLPLSQQSIYLDTMRLRL